MCEKRRESRNQLTNTKEEIIFKSKETISSALLNVTSLAKYLGVGRTTVYEWLHSEQLPPAIKIINKRRYWTKQQIENFLGGK